jgi:hypothetical protein
VIDFEPYPYEPRKESSIDMSRSTGYGYQGSPLRKQQASPEKEKSRERFSSESPLRRRVGSDTYSPERTRELSPARHPYMNGSPLRKSMASLSYTRSPQRETNERLSLMEVTTALKDFIFLHRELESELIALVLKQDFNLLDAFSLMDQERLGAIS